MSRIQILKWFLMCLKLSTVFVGSLYGADMLTVSTSSAQSLEWKAHGERYGIRRSVCRLDKPPMVLWLDEFGAAENYQALLIAENTLNTADAYHKEEKSLARLMSNRAKFQAEQESGGCHPFYSKRSDHLNVDGVDHEIKDPKAGSVEVSSQRR